jgi:prepilin-type N-terminal cleavage/methylation domain-containing protein
VFQLGRQLRRRASSQDGFGMIELIAAISILLIGLMAVYTMFQAGLLQIRRAGTMTTAAALAATEMEKYRAIKYEALGLDDTDVGATDGTYTADSAYRADTGPSTTLAAPMTASQETLVVASASGFPTIAPFLVKVENEFILVSDGAGTTTWTVTRAQLGTTAATHAAGVAVTQKQRVHLVRCGTQPCTNSVPTKTAVGADGKRYRIDTYMTWQTVTNSATPSSSGRVLKLITIVVREELNPSKAWARVSSAFDESTGL